MMYIQRYILLFFFLSSPCFAYFTNDVVLYTMSSYFYDHFKERQKMWESEQVDHLHTFQQKKEQEMRSALKKEKDRLNQLPKYLRDQRESLNTSISHYNNLLSQWKRADQEKQDIQEEINKVIQKIEEQEATVNQIILLGDDINVFMRMVNGQVHELTELEVEERELGSFYNQKKYLQDDSIVSFKTKWDAWKQDKDREYEAQAINYNNKVEEFKIGQQSQKQSIESQKIQLRAQQEELDKLVQSTNALISEYNEDIKEGCKVEECEKELLDQKNYIEEEKEKIETEKRNIANLISVVNEQNDIYNEEHIRWTRELEALKHNTEALSHYIHEEHKRHEQEWKDKIKIQKEKAQENWEIAQQQLNQFRATLNTDYGDNFRQFVEQLSNWSNINQEAFTNLTSQSISQKDVESMQASNNILCENNFDLLPAKVREICNLTKRVADLLNNISYFDVALNEWREKLKQKNQEITDLKTELSKLNTINNQLQSEWDTQLQQHNKTLPEREAQYDRFSREFKAQLNEQIQEIQQAYNKKNQLLIAEYYFIYYLFFVLDKEKSDALLAQKKVDFESAQKLFLSSLPTDITSFSSEFMETNELVFTILEQGHWSKDISSTPLSFTSSAVQNVIEPLEEEQKKQVILSWMRTKLISHFLITLMERVSEIFDGYEGIYSKNDFIEQMFLNSIYQLIPIRQVAQESLVRYQITYDDRVFWILPEGQLSIPKGFYQ